jgi:hypothetical protein
VVTIEKTVGAPMSERFVAIDWNEIKRRFQKLRDLLKNMRDAPSEEQVEAHTIMRKLKLTSVLDAQFCWGYHLYGSGAN